MEANQIPVVAPEGDSKNSVEDVTAAKSIVDSLPENLFNSSSENVVGSPVKNTFKSATENTDEKVIKNNLPENTLEKPCEVSTCGPPNDAAEKQIELISSEPSADTTDDVEELDDDIDSLEISASFDPLTEDGKALFVGNEEYNAIIEVCSSTAQSIRKTITDVLSNRDRVIITEDEDICNLEASLNEKIADFEKTVTGCMKSEKEKDEESPEKKIEEISNTLGEEQACGDVNESKITTTGEKEPAEESSRINTVKVSDLIPSDSQSTSKDAAEGVISYGDEKFLKKQKNLSRKKAEKTMDQVLKSLSACTSGEEKLQLLCSRHVSTLEDLRLFEARLKQLERHVTQQLREKEQLQAEHNRMVLAKSRLEGLCRELQRQNKAVKEESLLRLKEEEEKRKEVANKFQATLNDISTLMQENSKKNIQLREENCELANKLKSLVDNYEVWEQNMNKVVQQKDLEVQLVKMKHAKVNLVLKRETEKFLREKQSLLLSLSDLQSKCTQLTANELQLRNELGDYTSKYEEFQSVLNNSNKVFATFKTDMDTTSKRIKKLEKETNVYKQKWESSNKALLDMISLKEKHDKELLNAQQRITMLEKLCRALQSERNELQNKLLSNSESTTENVPEPLVNSET